ncbi:MAG: hypothetical protein JXB29_06045 [Sedimentisphaerales bacterium]|nr:hypothetical protein [Sedimentisphaerales bacterium]
MKAKHRHELKTNELAEWIQNFPQWAKQNRTTIIYVSVVVILVLGVYLYKKYQKNVVFVQKRVELTGLLNGIPQAKMQVLKAQAKGLDLSYGLIQLADNLQIVADSADNAQSTALALIKRGDILRSELLYRSSSPIEGEIAAQIAKAKESYTQAAVKASSNPQLLAMAKLGLGLCEEELANFDGAEEIYSDIAADTRFEGTTAAPQAKYRLESMDDYKVRLVFKSMPQPKRAPEQLVRPEVALRPEREIQPADANLVVSTPNITTDSFLEDTNLPGIDFFSK